MKDPHQEDTTSLYDLHAEEYKSNTEKFVFPGNMFEDFLKYIPWKKVIDVGCAYGRDMLRMKEKWFHVQGIEISRKLIEIADLFVQKDIICADMTELWEIFSKETFDWVFAAASILHLEKDLGLDVLKDIFSLLKTGGILFFEAKISSWEQTYTELKKSVSLPWKYKKYTLFWEIELDTILESFGFSIIKTHKNESQGNIWKIYICKK